MSRNVRFMLALVMLTLFLGSGAAHALPSEGRDADRALAWLVAVWEWVTSLCGGRFRFSTNGVSRRNAPAHSACDEWCSESGPFMIRTARFSFFVV